METPDGRRYLEGNELEPYKVPDSGKCWWCGGTANSREHKFKRTDLTRMWGTDDHLVWISYQRHVKVRSARKSPIVKFAANMCAPCNNTRSQPFDAAYDKFADYIWSHLDDLWRHRFLDMRLIYRPNWQGDALNLARYFAKQLACRMANDGYLVPSGIAPFLDGQPLLPKLIANCVIYSAACDITDAANAVAAAEGEPVDPADLATISPYITSTVRRFGNWTLNLTPPERAPVTRLDLDPRVLFAPPVGK